ncbi:thioesterase family protein [Thalassotalea ponticola]|uniref:acyl-CoA thioesterase n=1 Tax=Thalassotalea ponticola TaxID=1523392 RepID=UPI0025B5BD9F|nr:thioesterase family protein [Thalassotalea ponticola]MDN3653458.1 thioesterase family protein [Thalassotalea ponticola]
MFHYSLSPAFSDTDALGHINNSRLPIWFENARTPIFKLFNPQLDLTRWPLIVAKIEVTFLAQIYYGQDVEIQTSIDRIGNSSFTVKHALYQGDNLCAQGSAVMVHFDYQSNQPQALSDSQRQALGAHMSN